MYRIVQRDPWGKERPYQYGNMQELATSYLFTNQRWDERLGLYDYNARYYDAGLGRFISADSIVPLDTKEMSIVPFTIDFSETVLIARYRSELKGEIEDLSQSGVLEVQTLNRYAYVNNSPTDTVDPTGHMGVSMDMTPQETLQLASTLESLADIYEGASQIGKDVITFLGDVLGETVVEFLTNLLPVDIADPIAMNDETAKLLKEVVNNLKNAARVPNTQIVRLDVNFLGPWTQIARITISLPGWGWEQQTIVKGTSVVAAAHLVAGHAVRTIGLDKYGERLFFWAFGLRMLYVPDGTDEDEYPDLIIIWDSPKNQGNPGGVIPRV